MPPCTTDELEDFPRRMREWLSNVMGELAQRGEVNENYQRMAREAEVGRIDTLTHTCMYTTHYIRVHLSL